MASADPASPPPKKPKMSDTTSPSPSDDDVEPTTVDSSVPAPPRRYKRRKVAIFLAYCGFGYQGMQKNPGARTIEGDLEEALFFAGGVPAADRGNPRRYDWARAARTDKGVSAAAQVVSGRFYVDPPGFVDRLNSHLDPQIRVFGYKRVTNSFNAKKFCDKRRYVYLLPVFALDPSAHPDRESVIASLGTGNELSKCVQCSERGRKVGGIIGRQVKSRKEEENMDTEEKIEFERDEKAEMNSRGNELLQFEDKYVSDTDRAQCNSVEVKAGSDYAELNDSDKKSKDEQRREFEGDEKAEMNTCAEDFQVIEKLIPEKSDIEEKPLQAEDKSFVLHGNGEQMPVKTREFQYGEKEKERFEAILRRYEGTHNFHNFTTRTKAEDPSARRYIISFHADRVVSLEGIDFIRCEVVGQSFMLHQIRKMIGLAVAIMRNCAPESLMDVALKKEVSINVPTAPEVGLYLDECLFTSYNKKWKSSHEAVTIETYAEQAEEFRMKHIYSHIASMELKEGAVALWLHSLNHRNYPDLRYMETNGDQTHTDQAQAESTVG